MHESSMIYNVPIGQYTQSRLVCRHHCHHTGTVHAYMLCVQNWPETPGIESNLRVSKNISPGFLLNPTYLFANLSMSACVIYSGAKIVNFNTLISIDRRRGGDV